MHIMPGKILIAMMKNYSKTILPLSDVFIEKGYRDFHGMINTMCTIKVVYTYERCYVHKALSYRDEKKKIYMK